MPNHAVQQEVTALKYLWNTKTFVLSMCEGPAPRKLISSIKLRDQHYQMTNCFSVVFVLFCFVLFGILGFELEALLLLGRYSTT
jgi:hypothetical protein